MVNVETKCPNGWGKGSLWEMTTCAQVVTFIGAGGKTTCLQAITQDLVSQGQRVIATTTTKVFPEAVMKGWKNPSPPPCEEQGACFWYVDVLEKSGKWRGPSLEMVDAAILEDFKVYNIKGVQARYWVIEGDGAKGLKLKCWEPHEPQIPQRSDCVVLVLKGGLWGNVLRSEQVHRPESCLDLLGHAWNAEKAWRYFLRSPVFAPQYGQMSWVILLNCHGGDAENKDRVASGVLLEDLLHRFMEIQLDIEDLKDRPCHLRIAAGNAKEGKLQWFDLW
ncbi:MAG TPA: selenium cofactor biosynthesis protein YqeC [Desulfosporosinus sp.]|nr:selenium cofactor biosynthesis protein YqeC [Desulfosporosinus sp.]